MNEKAMADMILMVLGIGVCFGITFSAFMLLLEYIVDKRRK